MSREATCKLRSPYPHKKNQGLSRPRGMELEDTGLFRDVVRALLKRGRPKGYETRGEVLHAHFITRSRLLIWQTTYVTGSCSRI